MVSMFERDQTDPSNPDVDIVVRLNNKEIYRKKIPLDFEGQARHRAIIRLQGIPVENPGDLTFQVGGDCVETAAYNVLAKPVETTLTQQSRQAEQGASATREEPNDAHEEG